MATKKTRTIATKRGDDGTTDLRGGVRTQKTSLRIEAIGAIDELNATIGLARTRVTDKQVAELLLEIQAFLISAGGVLSDPDATSRGASPGSHPFPVGATEKVETWLEQLERELPPLRRFITPGGSGGAAECHLARTVCRRAERRVHALATNEPVDSTLTTFLNRLSDLLFVFARRVEALDSAH